LCGSSVLGTTGKAMSEAAKEEAVKAVEIVVVTAVEMAVGAAAEVIV
jgi:hypothetical protein